MKTILAVFLMSITSLLGQQIKSASVGPVYDDDGRMIAYNYADGTRELYSYDAQWRIASFFDRAGNVTHFWSNDSDTARATATAPSTAPIDSTLFTTYSLDNAHTNAYLTVCGSLPQSSGCYGFGSLGPFGKIGALIEGYPTTDVATSTVTRYIYVVDIATGGNQNGVTLYVYKKTDMITSSFDTVTVTLFNTVSLPLVGGTSASASMAANKKFVVVGTDQSPFAYQIQKSNFALTPFGGFSPPINTSSITADQYGYITITFGSFSGSNGFIVVGPQGSLEEDGGGAEFMLGTQQAALPSTFP